MCDFRGALRGDLFPFWWGCGHFSVGKKVLLVESWRVFRCSLRREATVGHDESEEAAFVAAITPDVMRVLRSVGFFAKLDGLIAADGQRCSGDYALTRVVMAGLSFPEEDVEDVLAVLHANGGHCDCEILYNVASESTLSHEYWTGR